MSTPDALKVACQQSIVAYAMLQDPKYEANRFHRLVAEKLEAAVKRGHGRIIIEAPPQHGKSRMISQDFPAWFMGNYPYAPVIAYAYGVDLSERNGQEVRDRMGSSLHSEIFGQKSMLRGDTASKTHFMTVGGGRYIGSTVRGGATGFGARLAVIDDPFKNRAEAESPQIRTQVQEWYQSVVYTRLEEPSILVIMHTRWHEEDLAGWLQKEHTSENWEVISLPALAFENDLLGRAVDEPLLPERRSFDWLTRTKQSIGQADWLSLYQQTPTSSRARAEFDKEWFILDQTHRLEPNETNAMTKYMVIDPSRTQSATSDFTAMAVIGLNDDGNRYVLEIVRDKLTIYGRYKEMKRLYKKWNVRDVHYKKTAAESEIEAMKLFMKRDPYNFPILPLAEKATEGGKNSRIRRLVPDLQALKWFFPRDQRRLMYDGDSRDMMQDFIQQEVLQFPHGEHDDMLDCLSGAYDIVEVWPADTHSSRGIMSAAYKSKGGLKRSF